MEKFFQVGGEEQEQRRRSAGAEGAPLWAVSSPAWQEGVLAKSVEAEEFRLPTKALSGARHEGHDSGGEASRET